MSTFAEHQANIKAAIAELKAGREKETTLMMLDEIAVIKSRVINEGKTADGGSPGGYSEAVVPYWMLGSNLKNAAFNVKKKQEELRKKKGYFASYKDWREINNRPVTFKNFSFTGTMWKAVEPVVIAKDDTSTTYVIGSTDPEIQKLINFNKAQSGDFLAISKQEQELLHQLNQERVLKVLQKHNVA